MDAHTEKNSVMESQMIGAQILHLYNLNLMAKKLTWILTVFGFSI